ncbi:MAG: magnesium/cobalt transporter CorA [Holophagales bacterium]|nr:magnesium/cobalt transporter CorA [Holophagales bacterium]
MTESREAAPGGASPVPPEPPEHGIVNSIAYKDGRRVATVEIEEIPAALADPGVFAWVGLYEPDEELLERVQNVLGLHDLAIEDAHQAHQRPKLERYGDSLFLVLRTARFDDSGERIEFGETHVFVGARYFVTVRHGSYRSHLGVRARCEAEPDALALGPACVLHSLLDFVVDQYFPILEELEDRFESIEEDVFDGHSERRTTERLYELRSDLVSLRRAISPLVEITGRLERFESALVPEGIRVYLRDVHDHALRIHEMLEGLRELSISALEAHLSLLSISQSEDTRKLAAWAAIIAVPTMLAGIYGMNFHQMPELDWRFGYPAVLALMGGACGLLYRQFKKIGWL